MLAAIFGSVLPEASPCEIKGLNKNQGIVFTADEKNSAMINWTLPDLLSKDDTYITLATFLAVRESVDISVMFWVLPSILILRKIQPLKIF